ncbi:MAG: heavy-metal-associated domain-containing protein [Candidatus Nanopelagicaceae bacterium]|jgi:copper chaperone|nr:copper chaperone [Actinomycetota bacterium]
MSQDVLVKGLTCGHCVNHVSGALKELSGVSEVTIDLVANGVSTVHISGTELSVENIAAALKKAGPKYVIA